VCFVGCYFSQSLKLQAEVSVSGDSRAFRKTENLRKKRLIEFPSPSSCHTPEETDSFRTAAVYVFTSTFASSRMKQVVAVNGPASAALEP